VCEKCVVFHFKAHLSQKRHLSGGGGGGGVGGGGETAAEAKGRAPTGLQNNTLLIVYWGDDVTGAPHPCQDQPPGQREITSHQRHSRLLRPTFATQSHLVPSSAAPSFTLIFLSQTPWLICLLQLLL
jgi:hypothetical protein